MVDLDYYEFYYKRDIILEMAPRELFWIWENLISGD